MSTPTYTLINQITLAAASSDVIFSAISGSYKDLIMIVYPRVSGGGNPEIRITFNGVASGYSSTMMFGDGSTAGARGPNSSAYIEGNTFTDQNAAMSYQIMDYSATDKHKTMLQRNSNASTYTLAQASRWADSSPVNSVRFFLSTGSFATGSTFSLYGIVG